MGLLKDIFNKNKDIEKSENIDLSQTYKIDDVKVCQLAVVSNKTKKRISASGIIKRIVKNDVLMVRVKPNWYMDIESGKTYELGCIFGEELECPSNKHYVAGTEPFEYTCYETLQIKGIDVNEQYSASEIRQIYNEHFENNIGIQF